MSWTWNEVVFAAVGAVLLVLLNAVFVAAEFSLVKLRFTRIQSFEQERARRSVRLASLLARMSPALKVIRLGVTLCTVALGFVMVPLAHAVLAHNSVSSDGWIATVVLVACFVLAVAIMFVVGELVPRALALQFPVQTLSWTYWGVAIIRPFTAPFLALLNGFSSRLLGVFSIDSSVDLNLVDVEAQIRSLMSSGEELPPIAEKLLYNVLEMRKRVAQDILLPRNQIVFLDLEDSAAENLQLARQAGHTRFPVCEGDLDHCIGLVHIKDIFRSAEDLAQIDWRRHRRDVLRFAVDESLENVLQRMLKQRVHFALVADEFGGVVGAVTLENVLEELVGDILDEFDKEEAVIRPADDGTFTIDGLAPLHDVNEALGVELAIQDVSTFGGYISSTLGHMPRLNETLQLGRLSVTVTNVNERRIVTAHVRVVGEHEGGDAEEAAG